VTAAQMAQMQAQLTRMQAQMQAQTAQKVAQAQRSWWPRGSGAAVASNSWSARIGIAVRVGMAVALPWSFARLAQFVQTLYAQLLPSSGAAALDGWMNAILMTLLGVGFLAACAVFMLVLPRMLKNR
jgi:Sec-independent protein secretion pathway component TatC